MSWLANAIAGVVTAVWALVIYQATRHVELMPLATIVTPVMLAVVGGLVGFNYAQKRRGNGGRDDK